MSIPPYPLHWPEMLPRTERKVTSQFRTSLSAALKNVSNSLQLFAKDSGKAVTEIVLSSNAGGLSLGQPKDPGVAAWFEWDGEQRCIAVDRYPKVEDNLQAIHHIIEARRTEMRHGGLHIVRQTFKGFTALPAPPGSNAFDVLGIKGPGINEEAVEAAYRRKAQQCHPDKPGGSHEKMAALNKARGDALRMLGSGK